MRVHFHRWRPALVLAALCAAISMLMGVPAGAYAAGNGQPVPAVKGISVLSADPSLARLHLASIPGCEPGPGDYNRTQACYPDVDTVNWYNINPPYQWVGSTELVMFEDVRLNAAGRGFSDHIWVYEYIVQGDPPALDMDISTGCASPCEVTKQFPAPSAAKVGTSGTVDFSDSVGPGKVQSQKPQFTLVLYPAAPAQVAITPPVSWNMPLAVRCDDDLYPQTVTSVTGMAASAASLGPAGCVFPKSVPTLTLPISKYGASAAMIRWAQQHLSGKWGLKSANKPLKRLGNTAQATKNRKIVCQTNWVALPKKVPNDSCDEYAFAGSQESAGLIPGFTSGAACAQVIAYETKGAWNSVKPLGTYSAADKCVRGHIPKSQNIGAGGVYGRFVLSQRLLPGDPFWVAITS